MRSWSTDGAEVDVMGGAVNCESSPKGTEKSPPLKNCSELRESGYLVAVGSRTARFRNKHRHKMLSMILLVLLLLILSLAIAMTVLYVKQRKHRQHRVCESRECLRSAANLALSMDRTADPCVDFYQFVCGNWAEEHPRPDAFNSYDWFRDKQLKVFHMVREFLGKNTTNQPLPVKQAKEMYAACMDTEQIDKQGIQPVLDILKAVGLPPFPTYVNYTQDLDYSSYTFDWLAVVTKVKTYIGMDILIGFDIFSDPQNATTYRLVMGSPETTNPFPSMYTEKRRNRQSYTDRKRKRKHNPYRMLSKLTQSRKSYALGSDDTSKQTLIVFYAEIIKLFVMESNEDTKPSNMSDVEVDQLALQTASDYYTLYSNVYDIEYDNETETDYESLSFSDYTVDEMQAITDTVVESEGGTPTPIWKSYLEQVFSVSDVTLDFDKDKVLIAPSDLKYLATMATLISKESLQKMELYIWIKTIEVLAVHTTTEMRFLFARSREEMRERRRPDTGAPSRSLLCAGAVNDMLGMAVAHGIVDPHFLNVTRPKIKTMLTEMKNALARSIGKAKWMDDDTKLASYEKILEMRSLIGFPDWLTQDGKLEEYYEGIDTKPDDHLGNMMNIVQVRIRRKLNKYHDFKNYTWATDPTEVNAYHTYQENTITVPMVMLQYPFYDLGLDSLNYGCLGTIIGHEITHGFDNFGRQFDKNGNMLQWWSNGTIESFLNMTQCFVNQYSSYSVPELDSHVDGTKTLGENIADNGGVHEAIGALREHLARRHPEPKLPGFEDMTPEQLFFISYGNLWCSEATTEYLSAELDDEHAPQRLRARGALQNSAEFARAWRCPPGAPMNPKHKCIIF